MCTVVMSSKGVQCSEYRCVQCNRIVREYSIVSTEVYSVMSIRKYNVVSTEVYSVMSSKGVLVLVSTEVYSVM